MRPLSPRLAAALAATILLPALGGMAAAAPPPGILYSVDSRGASLSRTGGSTMQLSLPSGTKVTWFTDRPARNAGSITLRQLAAMWTASGFDTDPPNAALLLSRKGEERTHVVEMTEPAVRGTQVAFRVRPLPRSTELGHAHTHPLAPGRYAAARLFIDDAALRPCSSALRYVRPMPLPSPELPATVQCLLAPGASVSAYVALQSTSLWACRVGGTSDVTVAVKNASHPSLSVWSCGTTAVPDDVWLGSMNNGQCSSATSPITATNSDRTTTLRMTLYVEYPLCVVE